MTPKKHISKRAASLFEKGCETFREKQTPVRVAAQIAQFPKSTYFLQYQQHFHSQPSHIHNRQAKQFCREDLAKAVEERFLKLPTESQKNHPFNENCPGKQHVWNFIFR